MPFIAFITAPGEAWEKSAATQEARGADPQRSPAPFPAAARGQDPAVERGQRVFISPRARRLADEHNIPLADLKPTGPEGAIVERDVRSYLDARVAPISPVARRMAEDAGLDWRGGPGRRPLSGSGPGGRIMRQDIAQALDEKVMEAGDVLESIPLTGVRALIAERMAASSASTASVTLNSEADATAMVALRRQLAGEGIEISYNALLLHMLGRALREHPRMNASLAGDAIQVWKGIHVGLAVDSGRGLLVPVVRDVDGKGLSQLENEIRALAGRARTGRCTPQELQGGTFTLTNLGMYGIDSFTPIINLPECAILGVGRIKTRPAFAGDEVVARQMVWLSLTFDHRLVDGAPAARFLQRVVQLIEHPHLLLS